MCEYERPADIQYPSAEGEGVIYVCCGDGWIAGGEFFQFASECVMIFFASFFHERHTCAMVIGSSVRINIKM